MASRYFCKILRGKVLKNFLIRIYLVYHLYVRKKEIFNEEKISLGIVYYPDYYV